MTWRTHLDELLAHAAGRRELDDEHRLVFRQDLDEQLAHLDQQIARVSPEDATSIVATMLEGFGAKSVVGAEKVRAKGASAWDVDDKPGCLAVRYIANGVLQDRVPELVKSRRDWLKRRICPALTLGVVRHLEAARGRDEVLRPATTEKVVRTLVAEAFDRQFTGSTMAPVLSYSGAAGLAAAVRARGYPMSKAEDGQLRDILRALQAARYGGQPLIEVSDRRPTLGHAARLDLHLGRPLLANFAHEEDGDNALIPMLPWPDISFAGNGKAGSKFLQLQVDIVVYARQQPNYRRGMRLPMQKTRSTLSQGEQLRAVHAWTEGPRAWLEHLSGDLFHLKGEPHRLVLQAERMTRRAENRGRKGNEKKHGRRDATTEPTPEAA